MSSTFSTCWVRKNPNLLTIYHWFRKVCSNWFDVFKDSCSLVCTQHSVSVFPQNLSWTFLKSLPFPSISMGMEDFNKWLSSLKKLSSYLPLLLPVLQLDGTLRVISKAFKRFCALTQHCSLTAAMVRFFKKIFRKNCAQSEWKLYNARLQSRESVAMRLQLKLSAVLSQLSSNFTMWWHFRHLVNFES